MFTVVRLSNHTVEGKEFTADSRQITEVDNFPPTGEKQRGSGRVGTRRCLVPTGSLSLPGGVSAACLTEAETEKISTSAIRWENSSEEINRQQTQKSKVTDKTV